MLILAPAKQPDPTGGKLALERGRRAEDLKRATAMI